MSDLIRGNQLMRNGKLEEAVAAYQKAISHNPIFHWSHYKLGEALEQLCRYDEAIVAYRKALELNSDCTNYHYQLVSKINLCLTYSKTNDASQVPPIHLVGIGLGMKEHLTFAAHDRLINCDYVYMMTRLNSWMYCFVKDITGSSKIRVYRPENVQWNNGWEKDPIFIQVVDEVQELVSKGNVITFAMAGCVSIYGNCSQTIIPLLRSRGMAYDVSPGISFLNALSILTKESIVSESDNLIVTFARYIDEIDAAFSVANVVVLYNATECCDLLKYIRYGKVSYAKMVVHGVYGKKARIIDLLTDNEAKIQGTVILRKKLNNNFLISKNINHNKIIPFDSNIRLLNYHLGLNCWDSKNRFFAVCFPDYLMWSKDGNPQNIKIRYQFPDRPPDIRGLFIDSKDNIYMGLKGFQRGYFARTFVSRDAGSTFTLAFDKCFWGMDQDKSNNIFAGIYHERTDPDASCSVLWSADDGNTWVDISSPQWKQQNHVHHVAVNPSTGYLYACLGDQPGMRGCWRSKVLTVELATAYEAGSMEIKLPSTVTVFPEDILVSASGLRMIVEDVIKNHANFSTIRLKRPLSNSLSKGCKLMKLDWELKISDFSNQLQFIGICFKDEYIYLSDDTNPRLNPDRVIVYRAKDDGSSQVSQPEAVLKVNKDYGWGCFFLECDQHGRIWAAVRPYQGKGCIWYSDNGSVWTIISEAFSEDLPCWRGTHTYRDSTLQQTGYGRFLSGLGHGIITPHLNGSLIIQ